MKTFCLVNSKESPKIVSSPTWALSGSIWASVTLLATRNTLLCRTGQRKTILLGICELSLAMRTVKYPADVLNVLWNNVKITTGK